MKLFKSLILITIIAFAACDVDYKANPNEPQTPPTTGLFNNAVKEWMDNTGDVWFAGRFTLTTMQYWHQSEYGDEDRYAYRESMRETWEDFYYDLENFRKILYYNSNEDTKVEMSAYGANENQIACTRIMMAWAFNLMANTWGDIPYYSFGADKEQFQALSLADVTSEEEITQPAYATQEAIFTDILKELDEAVDQLNENKSGFVAGDNIYGGDVALWKKFANSLRLRIALKIQGVAPNLAQTHLDDAQGNVFTANADNATFSYEGNATNAAPMYRSWNVDKRSDFAVGTAFVQLLKGETVEDHDGNDITENPFAGMQDPRLPIYAKMNSEGNYVGMPIAEGSAEAATFKWESLPGDIIINKPDFDRVLMDYAEVEFILSELNGWDQTHYENGVRASMEYWGVPQAQIDDYVNNMPPASEETVLTQKYIALYMNSHVAWMEYRRTGYPHTLIMPNEAYSVYVPSKDTTFKWTFTPIPTYITNDLPSRMEYPQQEYTLNEQNVKDAIDNLGNGDILTSKLWWDVND
ncbi:MAG: SusD/RagB family nutrient-binding outer membrane lipoprotein [Bacteroidales bacterium]|nr:SusD/RagB family nutrient-binding outer membrane lipoprotein [Bacteroidales bacterium]